MPGVFERLVRFVFGAPPDDEITKILTRLTARQNREREFEEVGVFVLSGGDEKFSAFSLDATAEAACAAIESMSWMSGISFVLAVPRPGVALEFSGCLDPADGFSLAYYDVPAGVECVSEEPPASLAEAKSVLSAFLRGESSWQDRFNGLGYVGGTASG